MKQYLREALETAKLCGECGTPFTRKQAVYLVPVRQFWRPLATVVTVPHCRKCVPEHWHDDLQSGRCETCGRVVFTLPRWQKKYHVACSRQCRKAIYPALARPQSSREKTCAVCGTAFTAPRSDAVTCSPACRQKAYRRRTAAK
jgi:hypothetical protein